MHISRQEPSPAIGNIADFDQASGSALERPLFNNRPVILPSCLLATVFLGFEAARVKLNASCNQMIPVHQRFIVNYMRHHNEMLAS